MQKIHIGDVVEIPTKRGLAYAQYTHKHEKPPRFGALLRILPGFFESRPKDINRLVHQKELFLVFFPLQAAINRGIFRIVGREALPTDAEAFPVFRCGNTNPKTGHIETWWLWDGERSRKVGHLTEEQMKLPVRHLVNDTLLIRWIEDGVPTR